MRQKALSQLRLISITSEAPLSEQWKRLASTLDGINTLFKPSQNYQAVSAILTSAIKAAITRIPARAWTANLAKTLATELAQSAMSWAYPETILIHALKQMPSNIITEIPLDLMEIMIDQGKVSGVQALIDREDLSGLHWNAYNPDQAGRHLTPLTHAIKTNTPNSLEIAKILIEHGVNLNHTLDGHESCVGGYAHGVNPPLEYCVMNGNLKTLQLLIQKGATQGLTYLVKRVIAAPETYPYYPNNPNQTAVLNYLQDIDRIRDLVDETRAPKTLDEHTLYQALGTLKQTLANPECTRDQLMQSLNKEKLLIKASAHIKGTFFIQPKYDESNGILQTLATLPLAYMIPDMNRSLKWLFFSPCEMSERGLSGPSDAVDAVMRHPDLLSKIIAAGTTASTLSLRATAPPFREMMPGLFPIPIATPIIQTSERRLSGPNPAVDAVMRDPDLLSKIIAVGTTASTFSLRATALTFREMIPAPRPTGLFVAPSSTAPQGDSQQAPGIDHQA